MHTKVKNITPMATAEFENAANEKLIELYAAIRKRMPGIRVARVGWDRLNATVYYPNERYVRGEIGFGRKQFSDSQNHTYFIEGPFIDNQRGGSALEKKRLRSSNADTLARKAKTELRPYTARDHAAVHTNTASQMRLADTPAEKQETEKLRAARKLLVGREYSNPDFSLAFCNALAAVTFPQEDIEHAKNLLLYSMSTEGAREIVAREEKRQPYYAAAYERRGQPVYDYIKYGGGDGPDQAISAPQSEMPEKLYMALATLNTLEVGGRVEGMGAKVSDDEFIVLKGALE